MDIVWLRADGNAIVDDTFLVLLNAHHEPVEFLLPSSESSASWRLTLDTAEQGKPDPAPTFKGGEPYTTQARSVAILSRLNSVLDS